MKNKFIAVIVFASVIVSVSAFAQNTEKKVTCYPLKAAPVIDGKIEKDAVWKDIPRTDGNFYLFRSEGEFAEKKTYFRVGYDSEAIYIAVECDEPDVDNIIANYQDGDQIWGEDSVEIFFAPRLLESNNEEYQFIVNSIGSRWNGVAVQQTPLGDWKAAVFVNSKKWSVEFKIPYEGLNITPEKGSIWGFNVCRNIYTDNPAGVLTSWAECFVTFHEPESFGELIFK